MRPSCLRVVAALLAPAAAVACARGGEEQCELPAATGAHRAVDDAPVFTLPDTGGFVLNGAPVARARVRPLLREVLASSAPGARAAFVWRPAPAAAARRCADVAFLAAAARDAGGAVYDAARSGWPAPIPDTGRRR